MLLKMRREYDIEPLCINKITINKLIIDGHLDKHSDHIDDELVKKLIRALDGQRVEPAKEVDRFKYFASTIKENDKWYKVVWLLENNSLYIGVITAFRDRRIK
jgi:hypothetical protein